MAYAIQLKIQKTLENFKMYIYRSTNAEHINTIAKLKAMQPIIILDEATYAGTTDGEFYVVTDKTQDTTGITYYGPEPDHIPTTEYESKLEMKQKDGINFPALTLTPLTTTYQGILYYYSIVAVKGDQISHPSKINAVLLKTDFKNTGSRELQSCEDYTGGITDHWKSVTAVPWTEEIVIGDVTKPIENLRFGNPFVEKVPTFDSFQLSSHVCGSYDGIVKPNYIRLEIPNVWRINNQKYNTRKLKSFRIRNIHEQKYSDFSEPSYQTPLPFPIESMIICRRDTMNLDPSIAGDPVPLENENILMTIIRKNGVYYRMAEHKDLPLNSPVLDTKDSSVAIYSEASVQEFILLDCHGQYGYTYQYSIYLKDAYGNLSEPRNQMITIS